MLATVRRLSPVNRQDDSVEEESAEGDILAVFAAVATAHRDRDAAGIVAHYAPDAVVFDLSPPLRSRLVACSEGVQTWLDTWDGPIELELRDFEVSVSGDIAYGHGYQRMAGKTKPGGEVVDFWMRLSVGLRRRGGRWRIVHEHTSVPFYMDGNCQPAFDLAP